jgi:hypothetical protein
LVSASSRDWGGLLNFLFIYFFDSAIPLEGGPAGSRLDSFEDPVSLLKSSDFGVWFNCSCVVFFFFFFFFLVHVNFRVWDPAMAGETFLSFFLVFFLVNC